MIFFRADGNPEIGAGHVMRCLAIANAGRALGEECLFVTAEPHFYDVITKNGHENKVLKTDYRNMPAELEMLEELVDQYRPSALFVDSYYVSAMYLEMLWKYCKACGCRLIYIDDVFQFAYPCDILLNYNIYGPEMDYESLYREHNVVLPKLLLGSGYAPLRAEFRHLAKRVVRKDAKNILVSTGGADPDHIAWEMVRFIADHEVRIPDVCFHVIIGSMNEDRDKIENMAGCCKKIIPYYSVQYMQKLMSDMDVAVSAAGSTLYELCATQTPAVTYILEDNQVPGAECFRKHGILRCAGDIREKKAEFPGLLISETLKLAENYDERVKTAEKQRLVVDGNGAERIMKEVGRTAYP